LLPNLQVGDAYVVAGLLPHCQDDRIATVDEKQVKGVCEDVLAVASEMIAAMQRFRLESGLDMHCRVGASLGPVLAGMLGRLQPRFVHPSPLT
jgi:class 3 adenylate cyclase